jgi:hypothetical protein
MFFYFLNPNFSQMILNGQIPVKAANGKIIGGAQCSQLILSNPAKQLAIKTTTPIERNVILADGDASPVLKNFTCFLFFYNYLVTKLNAIEILSLSLSFLSTWCLDQLGNK